MSSHVTRRHDPDEARQFPLRRVLLLGGGRWSRVLLPVMQSLLANDAEITWVTEHGYEQARRWLAESKIERVVVKTCAETHNASFDAAVVATAPATHAHYVRGLIARGIPTLCEKPFSLDAAQAVELEHLAHARKGVLGVHLELPFASYFQEFAELVRAQPAADIAITWFDPWSEVRYGEIKHGDVYTSIVDDMWPHCWSLIREMLPGATFSTIQLDDVAYEPSDGKVLVLARTEETRIRVELSRRFLSRKRRIEVDGWKFLLDFSAEPGWREVGGVVTTNTWQGLRPLSGSLQSFFEVVVNNQLASRWTLSLHNCLDSVRQACEISGRLRALQQQRLLDLQRSGVDLSDTAQRNLIVDALLPEYGQDGQRWPAFSMEQQTAFVQHVCKTRGIRYK